MSSVIGIIIAIVGLGFLILAHEFGHFIVAKATGMRVEEFSLGFGVYGISAIPLGGYVRVTGMHKEEFEARVAEAREEEAEIRAEGRKRRPQDPEDRLAGNTRYWRDWSSDVCSSDLIPTPSGTSCSSSSPEWS